MLDCQNIWVSGHLHCCGGKPLIDVGSAHIIDLLASIKGPYGVGLRKLKVAIAFHSGDPISVRVEIHQTNAGRSQWWFRWCKVTNLRNAILTLGPTSNNHERPTFVSINGHTLTVLGIYWWLKKAHCIAYMAFWAKQRQNTQKRCNELLLNLWFSLSIRNK